MNNTILYFVFGNRREFQLELTYSVLSAVQFLRSRDFRIALVCDSQNRRLDLPIEHLVVSDDRLNSWIGQYKYGAKAHALHLGIERYGGAVALVDTDTVFLNSPQNLFVKIGPGRSVMHADEGVLGDHASWSRLLNRVHGPLEGLDIFPGSRMMNSGVVGVHESDREAVLTAVRLMSALQAIEPIFNIEQFAFTAALSQRGQLAACEGVIWHYWGHHRRFAHAQIDALFPNFDADTFNRYRYAPPPIGMPPIPALTRVRARALQFIRRCDGDYRFAYLASLCAIDEHSNEWMHVTLDVLEAMEPPPATVARDFRRFRRELLAGYTWLDSTARERWLTFWGGYEKSAAQRKAKAT